MAFYAEADRASRVYNQRKQRKENTMQSLMAHFKNVFDYLFNPEWNPEYANAAHIKISRSTDTRFPNEIVIASLDSDMEIHSMYAYDADIALEPMSIEYEPIDKGVAEQWNDSNPKNCDGCANQESIAAPGETTKCREHQEKQREPLIEWMAKNIERPMDFSIFDSCENCHKFPPTRAIVGDSAIPFFLCDYCHGQYANLLPQDARKRLVHV